MNSSRHGLWRDALSAEKLRDWGANVTILITETEELRALSTDLSARLHAFVDIAVKTAGVARIVEAAGCDGYDIVVAASRTRHMANRLQENIPNLDRLANWLEAIERDGGRVTSLDGIAQLGLGGLDGGAATPNLEATLRSIVGRDVFSEAGGSVGMLRPSADSPLSSDKYTGDKAIRGWLEKSRVYGPTQDSKYQCTAWANFRWRELGYEGKPYLAGDGFEVARKAGPLADVPSLGALASYGTGNGHVMVVESVELGPDSKPCRFLASEGNFGPDAAHGTPAEWGATRWWVRDGSNWRPELPLKSTPVHIEFSPFRKK